MSIDGTFICSNRIHWSKIWRRSYDIAPPNGESLKDTAARVIPYFESEIVPKLKAGKNIVIAAHGNSLRALIMYLEKLTPAQILEFEIGTAVPRLYELDENLNVLIETRLKPFVIKHLENLPF